MRFWAFFFIIVGILTWFLPDIGNAVIGRPIVFLPFHALGSNAIYAHGATTILGVILLILSFFKKTP